MHCMVDTSPLKCSSPGYLPGWAFESLCIAVESFISINQINAMCHDNQKKNLSLQVNGAAGRDNVDGNKLLDHIIRHKSLDINAAKEHSTEA